MIDSEYFDARVAAATAALRGEEVLTALVHAEVTDFARLNHNQVRQAGTVEQASLTLALIDGRRRADAVISLSAEAIDDDGRVSAAVGGLRDQISVVPEDPYLSLNLDPKSTHQHGSHDVPPSDETVSAITARAAGRDLVGIYTSGTVASGFGNSLGQRNWFQTSTFNFDWTLYVQSDKAVKCGYTGFEWDDAAFHRKLDEAAVKIKALTRPSMDLAPDDYRVYLTPAAVDEVVALVARSGFGIRARRTNQSPFMRLRAGEHSLSRLVRLSEHTAAGIAPNFQEDGWLRPDEVILVDGGDATDMLVSPRSAAEFGVSPNGANASESPLSLTMAGGGLADADALASLGTGLHVGNLHYANFSDRPACRVTGMTRFETFWVEDGEIVAPVQVLRFDDSMYNLFGSGLVDLTTEPEFIVDPLTYSARTLRSRMLPGALVDGMRFTL